MRHNNEIGYCDIITSGLSSLLKNQKEDGGMPFLRKKEESGVWTTAEVLEAFLLYEQLDFHCQNLKCLLRMAEFLLSKYHEDAVNPGRGFWEAVEGQGPSAASTGHVMYSLILLKNKVLNERETLICFDCGKYIIDDIVTKIDYYSAGAVNWLKAQQLDDNGWNTDGSDEGSVLCTYYVIKGLLEAGEANNVEVKNACIFIDTTITENMKREYIKEERGRHAKELSDILYGVACLYNCGYLKAKRNNDVKTIKQFIKKHWTLIKNWVVTKKKSSEDTSYVYNFPYITLYVLLVMEDYVGFKKEINETLKTITASRQSNGTWMIKRGNNKEVTWVTAEMLMVLAIAESRYIPYINIVESPKITTRNKVFLFITVLLWVLFFITYIILNIRLQAYSNYLSLTIANSIFGVVGFISSIITIYSGVKN